MSKNEAARNVKRSLCFGRGPIKFKLSMGFLPCGESDNACWEHMKKLTNTYPLVHI